jgi:glycosyltransferase involved in cell wall biosynthesis
LVHEKHRIQIERTEQTGLYRSDLRAKAMIGQANLRIAAHIGVKDEVELVERCITHLRNIGVSEFIVCDMRSTDGTRAILDSYRSESFRIISASNVDPAGDWVRRNEEVARQCQADWLVFVDADEFILPASGSLLRQLDGVRADLLSVPRYNVPFGPSGPVFPDSLGSERYGEIDLIVEPIPEFRQQLKADPTLPWIRHVPVPKVIVRPHLIGWLVDGMHDVIPAAGGEFRRAVALDIVTAHLPFTTEVRFLRKIENVREVFALHDEYIGPHNAWHWRRWLELADRGEIVSEFQRTRFSDETLVDLRRRGIIRTAAEALRQNGSG